MTADTFLTIPTSAYPIPSTKPAAPKERPLAVGELVKVQGHRSVWRILTIAAGIVWLTNVRSFERVDLRDIPLAWLTRAEGIVA